jgi:hypothetical protein
LTLSLFQRVNVLLVVGLSRMCANDRYDVKICESGDLFTFI